MQSPMADDLAYFSVRLRKGVCWRASIVLFCIIGWFLFAGLSGLHWTGLNATAPAAILVAGLGVTAGTKLRRPTAPAPRG